MTLRRLSPELRAELDAFENQPLAEDEFAARVSAPWTEQELEDFTALVRWFQTRYPTAGERMRAIRNRMIQLQRRA